MADNPVNPKPSSGQIIPYQDPGQVLRQALQWALANGMIQKPTVQDCPLRELNIDLEFFYYYADGAPVPKASFVLLSAEGAGLMAGPLDDRGHLKLTVPKGVAYQFYFHHDQSPSGKVFDFSPPYVSKAGAPITPVADWPTRQEVIQAQPDVRFHWSYLDSAFSIVDPTKPLLERLIYHVVSHYSPLEGAGELMIEAALILEAMLLGSLHDAALWERLVLNRLGFALMDQSRIVQGIVTYVCRIGHGVGLPELINLLNRAGKGNAVDWLRQFANDQLPKCADAVAKHIDGLVAAVVSELNQIGTSGAQDAFNQSQARYLRDRLIKIPAARAQVDVVLKPVTLLLWALTQSHPALRDVGGAAKVNTVRQVRSKFPRYIPGPVTLPRVWFEVCYKYADAKLIEKASFQVRDPTNPEKVIGEKPLGPGGIGYVDLPAGPNYEFRFNADEVKLAFDAPEREGAVTPDTSGWVSQAIAADLFASGKKLVWKTALALTGYDAFSADPTLSTLLLACVAATGQPRRKTEPALDGNAGDSDKAADAAVAGLLRALLYADKTNADGQQAWWREISFHRLRAVRAADGPVIERLLALLHDRADLKLDTVTRWLNARGKGNSVAWLKEIRGKLSGYLDAIGANLEQALAAFDAELKKIAEPEQSATDKIGHANTVMASRLRERVAKLKPKESLADVWKTAEQRFDTLLSSEESKKTLRIWTAAKIRGREEYKQPQEKFPERVPPQPPEIPWVEVMFLYADQAPVKNADYKLTGGDVALTGTLDPKGFAFEIVEQGKVYEYEFSGDPNPFELAENVKLKAKGADVGANLVEEGIAAGVFKKGGVDLVRWGAKLYTSNQDFQATPDLSQIVNVVVRNKTPYLAAERDHEEITAFLFPLIMGKLLEAAKLTDVWKACSFQRLGGCVGEDGVVVRDLLFWLDKTADPPVLEAVKRLNSVGHGDAYTHLKTLHGKFDQIEKAVSDNLGAIMDALCVELKKLTDATDTDVLPEMKRFVKDIDARAKQVKTDAAAKVKAALAVARGRLDTVQQQAEPEYKGSAPVMEMTVRQQEKTALDPRPAATPPKLAWFDLEYQHHDNQFVEEAEYVVTNEDGLNVLYQGTLSEGYAHLVVPENLKFKYYFRRDKAFAVDVAFKCKANDGVNFPAAIKKLTRNAVLLKKFKKSQGGWGDCQMDDVAAFYEEATVGRIAYNVIRGDTISAHLFEGKAEAKEMAELLHPLLLRTSAASVVGKANLANYKDNSELWIHAVLNRLTVVLGENGRVVASMLWAIHNAKTPVAKLAKAKLLEHLNWAGRGNAIRWLEGLDVLKNANRDLVKTSLEAIFDGLRAELEIIKIRPLSGPGVQTARRLASAVVENYATMIQGKLTTENLNIVNNVQTAFTKLRAELAEVLLEARQPKAGVLHNVNLLVQTKTNFPPRVPVIPPWIELQYCYKDKKQVLGGQYELHDGAGRKDQGNLSANGYIYVTDIPALTTFMFKQDPGPWRPTADVADIPMYKKDENQKRAAPHVKTPRPGYLSTPCPDYQRPDLSPDWAQAPNMTLANYGGFPAINWGPDSPASQQTDYKNQPRFGKLARKCVKRHTARCCVPSVNNAGVIGKDVDPEENEAVEIIQGLIWGPAPAPNNLAFWSVLVMNRVGTSRAAGLENDESRIRRAVLLELHRSNPTLQGLIGIMNKAGKGHAVVWLRQLYAGNGAVKAGVVLDITNTLTELRTEYTSIYNYNRPHPHPPTYLPQQVRSNAQALSTRLTALMNAGNVANKVNQVLDPIFAKLNLKLPADPLNPLPFPQPVTPGKLNIFVQPDAPFPLAEVQRRTPPFWNLANPNTIQVAYKNTAGGDVTASYTVDVAATQANRNAVTNFDIGNVNSAKYSFKNDAGAVAFSGPYKPWTNPYLPITQGVDGSNKLLDNFLATLGAHAPPVTTSCFIGLNNLPWEGTDLIGRGDFAARPSLGKILARSVLVNMPRVAMANDVQDLAMALQRLITKPALHAFPDAWFRAAVIFAGTKADHGAVIRGLLLRVRKHGKLAAEEFFKLINLADGANGNAADWLKAQIPTAADINGSAAGLTAILTEFEAKLGVIEALPDPPVNPALKNFLQGVILQSQTAKAAIAAKVPACFASYATTLDNMRTNDLPIWRTAYLGLNQYQREKAAFFTESNQAILPARKEAIDQDVKNRIIAANQAPGPLPNPTRTALTNDQSTAPYNSLFGSGNGQQVYSTLLKYMDGNRGQSAKAMAPQLAQMNNHEFVEHMESLGPPWVKTDSAWGGNTAGMGAMIQYYNPADGTLIRYKPGGDEYQRPPAPMYSVEVTASAANNSKFKIDPNGNAVPLGPGGDTNATPYVNDEKSHYFDGISRAGHRSLRY